ncbi:carboxylate--amine ligase [Marinobacter fuscus]|uniref:Carboxylate--amine ligase n=2 Tax=Marinobacter fuscus TaxID=2109942 RepID=A0A2T1K4A7_9GAMM|nr:carboxylate--amine ligase [Marinobacter fuscus]
MEPRVLVLDGNQRAALAVVRSLGARGLWVATGETSTPSMSGVSRYSQKSFMYTDPAEDPRQFFNDVLWAIESFQISFLVPVSEASAYAVLAFRHELPEHVVLPLPETEAVEALANKNELFRLAQRLKVPIPDSIFCDNAGEGYEALSRIDHYPVVLKPFKSKIFLGDSILPTHVIVAHSKQEAQEALRQHGFFRYPFTIQSFIEGAGQGVFALFEHGEPICYFAHRRLREKPPGGGVSVLCESVPVDDLLRRQAEMLLREANWTGVAMVEFKVDHEGKGYLMEVNPRFWGSLQLAVDSGIDFPWWLYLVSTGQQVPNGDWHPSRLRWLMGDIDRLYLVLRSPREVYSTRRKLMEIFHFFWPSMKTRHEVNRWHDLRPFWYELRQYFNALKS